ncbi:hypothetical protein BOTBODRAFT_34467 [Botryobasidium botryosum FD-172 SS1]|uniref:Uncharacterized protein n=1 Tax=Botryobasidium botryosum (strain FD-172 SS1) TaxID=930990 RepID=A0A067M9Q7_BOTB1|nr:hypothetical protein BOTBODRAFT_34467 [Botryobasidium botryosum FD-172 SS1]
MKFLASLFAAATLLAPVQALAGPGLVFPREAFDLLDWGDDAARIIGSMKAVLVKLEKPDPTFSEAGRYSSTTYALFDVEHEFNQTAKNVYGVTKKHLPTVPDTKKRSTTDIPFGDLEIPAEMLEAWSLPSPTSLLHSLAEDAKPRKYSARVSKIIGQKVPVYIKPAQALSKGLIARKAGFTAEQRKEIVRYHESFRTSFRLFIEHTRAVLAPADQTKLNSVKTSVVKTFNATISAFSTP